MDWTKEDRRYAAATIAAAALVVYLIAANFGVVPSPVTGAARAEPPDVALPTLDAVIDDTIAAGPAAGSPDAAADVLGLITGGQPQQSEPTPAIDTTPPTSEFTTVDATVFVSLLEVGAGVDVGSEGTHIHGRSTDDDSGVASVAVTFSSLIGQGSRTTQADLDCADDTHRTCTWSVLPPAQIGEYQVRAQATDRAGNTEESGPTITVIVVSAQTASTADAEPAEEEDESGGLIGSVVKTVTNVLKLGL